MVRKGKGRQKIVIEKIKNENNLQVTFSKRRCGLFKKASELCILCGVKVGIIVFSPGQKVYSFGHPSIDHIINNYYNQNTNQLFINPTLEAHNNITLQKLNMELTYVQNLLDIENAQGQYLNNLKKDLNSPSWWDITNKDEVSLEQLEWLKDMMENLQNKVAKEQHNIIVASQSINNISYQRASPGVPSFDAQINDFFSSLPNATKTDGVGPSGTRTVPYDYHIGPF